MDFFHSVSDLSIAMVINYIRPFGILAPLVAFLLFTIQSALPVFPYIVLAVAGGVLFGFKMGFVLSWLGALAGACLAYWICKLIAGDWAQKKIKSRLGYDLTKMDTEMAFWTIVVARSIQVVPTPIINVAAAVGGVSFWNFFFSSAIGKIPSAVLYTGLGICLFQLRDIKLTLGILAVIILLAGVGRYLHKKNHLRLPTR